MSTAREDVLARVRAAVADEGPEPAELERRYRRRGELLPEAVLALFCERVGDYRAEVEVVTDPSAAAERVLAAHGARRVGIAADLPAELRPAGVELVEDRGLTPQELDALDGALTCCAAACAETGTIALDGGVGQGRRVLTLVPDLHVCLVRHDQIVQTVPELFGRLAGSASEGRPIVLVSGPSATSDIELQRVEGVHGPRRLAVLVHRGLA